MADPLKAVDLRDYAIAERDMAPHIDLLREYAKRTRTIVEFGTRGAVSTWAFLDGLPANGRMWSVDIAGCTVPPRVSGDERWTFIQGDDLSPVVQEQLPLKAGLVFIDTSHEYVHTKGELEFALTLSPKRILCHDAEWPGVAQAMAEFCEAHNWEMVVFNEAKDEKGPFSLAVLEPR